MESIFDGTGRRVNKDKGLKSQWLRHVFLFCMERRLDTYLPVPTYLLLCRYLAAEVEARRGEVEARRGVVI